MRIVVSSLAACVALVLVARASAAPPAIAAKDAQARAVLAQVQTLDRSFGRVVDEWDGAQIELRTTRRQLAANAVALKSARRQSAVANRRLANRLVAIYESHSPGAIEVLAGARSMSDVIDAVEVARDVSASDHRVATQARRARARLASARAELRRTAAANRRTVARLAGQRARIGALLERRKRLLASIQSEIAQLKAEEARRQELLAAQARARVARALAQAQARAAAAERATPPPAATTTVAATTTAAAATTTTAPAPPPSGGHADAASIALQYLGVPYAWGGATPSGFDCSGLVMFVFAQLGIQLPHYSAAQYGYGTPVARDQLQPGDLVFFDGLSHVGIYIGNGQMVHAPHTGDVVKISPLSEFGSGYVGARRL
jgi:cell wall-associated NlpC family hydrolase